MNMPRPNWKHQADYLATENMRLQAEVARLKNERWGACPEYHDMRAKIARLQAALRELHATVEGECPSLLNEDSGGNARLALEIGDLLADVRLD